MNDAPRTDAESKLAAPKLFGRKKASGAPHADEAVEAAPAEAAPVEPEPVETEPVETETVRAEAAEGAVVEPEPTLVVPDAAVESTEPLQAAAPVDAPPVEAAPVEAAPAGSDQAEPAKPRRTRAPRRPRSAPTLPGLPSLPGIWASAITGVLVGLFLVVATYLALHGCSAIRGTSTCGGAAGFPLLLAIGVVAVVGGGTILRAFQVSSPMGDSFLAVALVAVLTVLFLGSHYGAWWMLIVVPVLTAGAYALAHWVSVTYIDPVDD